MKKEVTEAEGIIAWLQTPREEREGPLTPKQMEVFQRWNMADDLLREHLSQRKVIPMLIEKYGYSKKSAERDIEGAMRSWAWRPRSDKRYMAEIIYDFLLETMVRAGKNHKYGDVARLAREAVNAIGLNKPDLVLDDANALNKPVAFIPVYDPALVGGTTMSDQSRKDLVDRMLKEKREKGFIEHSTLIDLANSDE